MSDSLVVSSNEVRRAAAKFTQWHILLRESDGTRDVVPSKRYLLKGMEYVKFLQYEKQGALRGINLGWTDDCEPSTAVRVIRWRFAHSGRGDRPVRYGEKVAIAWNDSYLRYGKRTVGINLDWSDTPIFEWRILGGPVNTPVRRSENVAVYNDTADEPLIAFDRTVGGDIGWPSSQTWGEQLTDIAARKAKEAIMSYLKGEK